LQVIARTTRPTCWTKALEPTPHAVVPKELKVTPTKDNLDKVAEP
jgi:hypothetical protein